MVGFKAERNYKHETLDLQSGYWRPFELYKMGGDCNTQAKQHFFKLKNHADPDLDSSLCGW